MRIFSGILGIAVLVLVVSFALSNMQDVNVGLWPLEDSLHVPLAAVGLVPLAFGFLVGGIAGWASGVPHRLQVRRLNKDLGALNKKIGDLQNSSIVQREKFKPSLFFWRRP
jgi:uncharacterized integral membrane protein